MIYYEDDIILKKDPVEIQQELIKIPDINVPISIKHGTYRRNEKEQWLQSYNIKDIDIKAEEALKH